MKFIVTLSILFVLLACNTTKVQHEKIVIQADGKEFMSVNEEGKVFVMGEMIGSLSENDVLLDKNKKEIARLDKDGTVYSGKNRLYVIAEDGTIDSGVGKKLSWTKEGKLQISEDKFLSVQPNNNNSKKIASFLFVIYSSIDVQENSEINVSENSDEDSVKKK